MRKLSVALLAVLIVRCGNAPAALIPSGDPEAGEEIYTTLASPTCITCHGADGTGVPGQAGSIVGKASATISETVRSGISTMPAYSQIEITDRQMSDLLAYVATF
jgi:mono/diheme cytochrome c family protein